MLYFNEFAKFKVKDPVLIWLVFSVIRGSSPALKCLRFNSRSRVLPELEIQPQPLLE